MHSTLKPSYDMMQTRFSFFSYLFLLVLLSTSCRSVLNIQDVVPTASFQGVSIRQFPPEMSLDKTELKLGLTFVYRNPYKKSLPIPAHRFTFTLNGKDLPGMPLDMSGFTIPAGDSIHRTYPISFDLNPIGELQQFNVLGKDNFLEFSSSFTVNLVEYTSQLANSFEVPIPDDKPGSELAKKYLDQKLGSRTLKLSHGQTLRLPALPQITAASQPISVRFLGQMESIDLSPVKDGMTPMIDLLVQGYENNVVADPFLNLMESEIDVLGIGKIKVADYLMGTVLFPFFGEEAGDKWADLKAKVKPASGTPLLNHFFLTFVDPNSPIQNNWEQFTDQWDAFKAMPGKIEYPGPRVTGMELLIPFTFTNTNEFSIEAPMFFADASLNNYHPITFDLGLPNGDRKIPAGASRQMRVKVMLNWNGAELSQGVMSVLQGAELTPNLQGRTLIDMGYGPMRVNMDLQNMLMKWGE